MIAQTQETGREGSEVARSRFTPMSRHRELDRLQMAQWFL